MVDCSFDWLCPPLLFTPRVSCLVYIYRTVILSVSRKMVKRGQIGSVLDVDGRLRSFSLYIRGPACMSALIAKQEASGVTGRRRVRSEACLFFFFTSSRLCACTTATLIPEGIQIEVPHYFCGRCRDMDLKAGYCSRRTFTAAVSRTWVDTSNLWLTQPSCFGSFFRDY